MVVAIFTLQHYGNRALKMTKSEIILEKLAFTTWETISNAFLQHISYGEDAITSVNLLSLKNEPSSNFVLQDTRINESTKGCDFEFWIGSNQKGWFRYAIQAKKITVSNERYNSLSHKVGGVPQIDILEKYSTANKAIPLYCLFNYSNKVSSINSGCPMYTNIKEVGCSVTPLKTVRKALNTRGARTFQWFHKRQETLPWSCLVRCPEIAQHWTLSKLGFNYKEMLYEKLPQPLRLLLDNELQAEQVIESDIFSQEIDYKPRWVGVIEITEDKD